MKIAITGHRPNKLGNDYNLTSPLIQKIKLEIEEILFDYYTHITTNELILISGMALGIDTLFAKIAIEHKFPFIAAIPFHNQDCKWIDSSKKIYRELLSQAKEVIDTSGEFIYRPELMQIRNEWMVDNCDVLIAVWNGTSGGTKNCINYAKKQGKQIIYINPDKL